VTGFEEALNVADAVLYEGYVLYPYRADDAKNVVRWQFGVLMPPGVAAADPSERCALTAQVLAEGDDPVFDVRLRFLQVQRRTVERYVGDRTEEVPRLLVGQTAYLPFDEAVPREIDVRAVPVRARARPVRHARTVPGGDEAEDVPGGRLVRRRLPLDLTIIVATQRIEGPYGLSRLRVDVENTSRPEVAEPSRREESLRSALVAAHLLVRVRGGRLVSMTDPPEWASVCVRESPSDGVWPVLMGRPGSADLALCSPIILPDHPRVAPESVTAFYDATEMDEMLSLRAMTLTEQEKQAVRGTDPRAAAILDDVDSIPAELMERLHGAVRHLSAVPRRVTPDEHAPKRSDDDVRARDVVDVGGVVVGEGSRVLLRPGVRRADAQDIFLAGRVATVQRVMHDVDGGDHLAVLLEDDEGRDVALAHGRFLFFAPDEVEPLGAAP